MQIEVEVECGVWLVEYCIETTIGLDVNRLRFLTAKSMSSFYQ